MAHTRACLRFADPIAETVARLTTGLGGLTLSQAGFAPAGRRTTFHEGIATSNSLGPALPGRTAFPIHLLRCLEAASSLRMSPPVLIIRHMSSAGVAAQRQGTFCSTLSL